MRHLHLTLGFNKLACKITFNLKEATEFQFGSIEKHQNGNYEQKWNEDHQKWKGLTQIVN